MTELEVITEQEYAKNAVIHKLEEILDHYLGSTSDQDNLTLDLSAFVLEKSEREVRDTYYSIVRDEKLDIVVRFAAYYSVFCYYIHIKCFDRMVDLYGYFCDNINLPTAYSSKKGYIEDNCLRFFAFDNAIRSQHFLDIFEKQGDSTSIKNSFRFAEKALSALCENAGALQNYADIVATGAEKGISEFMKRIDCAIKQINSAIEKRETFGLYYCTLGRLLALQGDFLSAKAKIRKAISLEPRNEPDSYRRVLQYQYHYDCVNLKEEKNQIQRSFSDINNELKEHQSSLNDIQIRNIELVSLFSGIVALVLTIPGFTSKTSIFSEALGLILSMGGVVSLSFCLIPTIMNLRKPSKSFVIALIPFLIGTLLIVAGALIGGSDLLSSFAAWIAL